jgi:Thioredoxin like C-terminal domain
VNGSYIRSVRVDANRLYTLLRLPQLTDATLELMLTRGVSAYAFTFG